MKARRNSIKKIIILLTMFYLILSVKISAIADNGETIVHVTKTGECYHSAGCGYLKSDIEMTLKEAIDKGYRACSACNPPVYDKNSDKADSKVVTKASSEESGIKVTSKSSDKNSTSTNIKKAVKTDTSKKKKTQSTPVKKKKIQNASTKKKTVVEEESDGVTSVVPYICGTIVALYLIYKIFELQRDRRREKAEKEKYEEERLHYFELYAYTDPLELVDVPEGVFLRDGYPSTAWNGNTYGVYTVYVGKNGKTLHFNPKCGGVKLSPINYYEARNLHHCKRCAVGKQMIPRIDWYIKYLEIKKIKEKYNIP